MQKKIYSTGILGAPWHGNGIENPQPFREEVGFSYHNPHGQEECQTSRFCSLNKQNHPVVINTFIINRRRGLTNIFPPLPILHSAKEEAGEMNICNTYLSKKNIVSRIVRSFERRLF